MKKLNALKMLAAALGLGAVMAIAAVAQTPHTLPSFALHDGNYTDLFNFNGSQPNFPNLLAQGTNGNLFGTVPNGGTHNLGIVFEITPSGTQEVLYNFDRIHGSYPEGGLVLALDGSLYGTTSMGGDNNEGTIFKITPGGILTTLHSFIGADGADPYAPPTLGSDGNFYGTTTSGTVYKMTPAGAFTFFRGLPILSYGGLVQATDGNFYDASYALGRFNQGSVFRMTRSGVVTILYDFDGENGAEPVGPLIQGIDGNLYGTTIYGGSANEGVVFQVTAKGITALHSFTRENDGISPSAGLVQATDGNFYGVTQDGGETRYGTIFQGTPTGNYSVVWGFTLDTGTNAYATPMQHTNGKIYGMTLQGGTLDGGGVVYGFDLGVGPFVRFVSAAGKVGQTGGILGQGFTGTTSVSLNGIPAAFTVMSDTYIRATVPPGATTGYVTVATPSGTLTSNVPFHVIP